MEIVGKHYNQSRQETARKWVNMDTLSLECELFHTISLERETKKEKYWWKNTIKTFMGFENKKHDKNDLESVRTDFLSLESVPDNCFSLLVG